MTGSAIWLALALAAEPTPLAARGADPTAWYEGRAVLEVGRTELAGLADRLDAIAQAGVRMIALPPILASADPAGLAPTSLTELDPRALSAGDLAKLLDAAHARDVAVVAAFEANHVSIEHPWFLAARRGDRSALARFVLFEEETPLARADADAPGLSFDPELHRWYYHALDAGLADLDYRDPTTRGFVLQGVDGLIGRGFDGVVLLGARFLFEDGPGNQVDRPDSIAFVREIRARLERGGHLVVLPLPGAKSASVRRWLGGEGGPLLALDEERGRRFAEAIDRADAKGVADALELGRKGPSEPIGRRGVALPVADGFQGALAAYAGAIPWFRALPSGPPLEGGAAIRRGLGLVLADKGGGLSVLRQDATERVIVLANLGRGGLTLGADPKAAGLDPKAVPAKVELSGRELRVLRAASDPRRLDIRFAVAAEAEKPGPSIDLGEVFSPDRGFGFAKDARRAIRCAPGKAKRCGREIEAKSGFGDPQRFLVRLPPGPYAVAIETAEAGAKLRVEGELFAGKATKLEAQVFVRDGLLAIEAVPPDQGGRPIGLVELSVRPAPFRPDKVGVDARQDRVVVRVAAPGVVKWRMDGSSAEPVESTPALPKGKGAFEATLGPWPEGAVKEVAFVIESKGGFVTGAGGQELVAQVPR